MDMRSLLSLLSDGEFHSGSELGEELGVSRAAVWKALSKLGELQIQVESVKGRGYRLLQPFELLSSAEIFSNLPANIRAKVELECLLDVNSTNQYLMGKDISSSCSYSIVLAESQTSGRGRRGRTWVSPFGKNIYLSCMFNLQGGVDALSGLSLVVGIAVVRAVKKCGDADVKLKWPNDVWLNNKKAAGILVELQGEATTGWQVIVGIGVNLNMHGSDAESIDQPWVALGSHVNCSRNQFAAAVVEELTDVLDRFTASGLFAFADEWRSMDLLEGLNVKVLGSELVGKAVGIDSQGALLIDTGDGITPVNAGEVSVRPA